VSTPNPASTPWVPLWALNGGIDLRYWGDYAPGSYTDGDVVVYLGTAYMCVRPTTAAPSPWPTVRSGYGTSLPASPSDGQEYTLVDSMTTPTYQWRFRYNAGSSSTYKWEYVGGADAYAEVTTDQSTSSTSFTDLATVGPSLTTPRAGDYIVEWGARYYGGSSAAGGMALAIGATAASDFWAIAFAVTAPTTGLTLSRQRKLTGLAASTAIVAKYRMATGGPNNWVERTLILTPVRVS